MPETARRVVLASRPVGEPKASDFRLEEFPVPQAGPGQVLLKTKWLSLDPYMRGRMSDAPSYAKPVGIGEVMEGGTVSEVVASNSDKYRNGDIVLSRAGWQTHMVSDGAGLRKLDPKVAPVSTALGVLGMPGMTAYTGLLEIGAPKAGETVVVSAASGAVGSVVGQVARIKGARAVGIAGGADKCRYVREEPALTLMAALRKMTLSPARRLEQRVPAMRRKGRLSQGADADVVVFDPRLVADRATYREPTLPPAGIPYVLVNGTVVVRDGKVVDHVLAGRPIRAPR